MLSLVSWVEASNEGGIKDSDATVLLLCRDQFGGSCGPYCTRRAQVSVSFLFAAWPFQFVSYGNEALLRGEMGSPGWRTKSGVLSRRSKFLAFLS